MEQKGAKITRVNLGSLALFIGLFTAVVGFAVSIAAWISTASGSTSVTNSTLRGLLFGLSPGIGAVILDTIIYFVAGLIIGWVSAALFNLVLSWMGGTEVATRPLSEMEARGAQPRMAGRRPEPSFGETVDNRRIDR